MVSLWGDHREVRPTCGQGFLYLRDRWQLQYIRKDVHMGYDDACKWCQKYQSTSMKTIRSLIKYVNKRALE
jgi:hypothetical protein